MHWNTIDSLVPRRCGSNYNDVIFKLSDYYHEYFPAKFFHVNSTGPIDHKSMLIQVMAWPY